MRVPDASVREVSRRRLFIVKALRAGARAREWVCNRLWIKISNYRTEGPMAYLVFTPFVSHIQASLAVHVSPLSILSGSIFVCR